MHLPGLIEVPLRLLLLIAGLTVPGSMVLRALRLPWSLAGSFLVSSATLYSAVLLFVFTGTTISVATLGAALGAVTLAGKFIPTRYYSTPDQTSSRALLTRMGPWLPLYLGFWAIAFYRLITQPLTGPDVYFRWSYLAEQMLKFGSLDFYPPRNAADFVKYFWAESIPPGIASLYAWAYGCGGSKLALWTSPVVALQLIALHELIWRLAHRWGGEIIARRAVLLAAACPLLTWSVLIGQETGMTAVSIAGIVWCIQNAGERGGWRWTVLAAICTAAAAGTREYGPVFAVIGLLPFLCTRALRSHAWLFIALSLPLALAWPLRVWQLTGNPVYSLAVRGWFPVNAAFIEWSDLFHGPVAHTFTNADDWQRLLRYSTLWALPAAFGLLAFVWFLLRRLREIYAPGLFVGAILLLWVMSVSHTAGGLFYSMRVLSPAFALLVVVASYAMGVMGRSEKIRSLLAFAVVAMLLESLPKTLVLPENPYRKNPAHWAEAGAEFSRAVEAGNVELVNKIKYLTIEKRRGLVTDMAGLPRSLATIGFEAIPLWSPEIDWLFTGKIRPEILARRWQASNFTYVAIAKLSPTASLIDDRIRSHPENFTVITVSETDNVRIEQIVPRIGSDK